MRKEYSILSIALCLVLGFGGLHAFEEKASAPPAPGDKLIGDLIGPPAIEVDPTKPPSAPTSPPAPPAAGPAGRRVSGPVGSVAGTATPVAGKAAPAPSAGQPSSTPPPAARKVLFAPVLPPKDYSPPVIYVDQPRYDFGHIFKGETVVHRFEIENKGGAPLMIQDVRPSCGCTVVNPAQMDKIISPGGKGGFELKLETQRLPPGNQQKYADVSSNDPKQSKFRVFIQGNIDAPLKVEPEQPRIQTVKGQGQGGTEINLRKNTPTETKVLGAKSMSGHVLVDLQESEPGSHWKLGLKTNYGPKDTQTYFNEKLELDIQIGERRLNQELYVTVQVKDRIELTPRSLYFKRNDFQPLKEKGTPTVKTVDIRSALDESHKFNITGLKIDDPDSVFKVTKETVKDGREYRLLVTIDKLPPEGDQKAQKSLKGNITLTTDDPLMQEISLRCIAFF